MALNFTQIANRNFSSRTNGFQLISATFRLIMLFIGLLSVFYGKLFFSFYSRLGILKVYTIFSRKNSHFYELFECPLKWLLWDLLFFLLIFYNIDFHNLWLFDLVFRFNTELVCHKRFYSALNWREISISNEQALWALFARNIAA